MPLRLLALALALVLLAPGAVRVAGVAGRLLATERSTPAAGTLDRLASWVGLVLTHQPGDLDPSAHEVSGWSRDTIDALFRYKKAFLVLVTGPGSGERARLTSKFSRGDLEQPSARRSPWSAPRTCRSTSCWRSTPASA